MSKVAFTMQLKPGYAEEYQRRHDAIWPELSVLLREAGISDYSIFLDETTGVLFAVHQLAAQNTVSALPQHAIMQRWWAYMSDIMETNPDYSPQVQPLRQVFHMD